MFSPCIHYGAVVGRGGLVCPPFSASGLVGRRWRRFEPLFGCLQLPFSATVLGLADGGGLVGFKRFVNLRFRRVDWCVAEDGGLGPCLGICDCRLRRLSDCSPNTDIWDLLRGLLSSVFGEFHAEVPKTEARWGSNGLLSSIFGE